MTEPVYFSLNTIGHLTQLYASPVIPKESNWLSLWLDGLRDMTFPVVFRQDNDTGGVKLVDFINTGWGSISGPVSDRVIGLLRDGGFTGWDTYPIEVYLKDGSKLPGYQGLTVTGRCNGLDPAATEQIDIVGYYPNGWSDLFFRGFPLDLKTWDGSDIFIAPKTSYVFISKRLHDSLKDHRISNIRFEKVKDILLDANPMFEISRFLLKNRNQPIPYNSSIRDFFYVRDAAPQMADRGFLSIDNLAPDTLIRYGTNISSTITFKQLPNKNRISKSDFLNFGTEFPALVSDRVIEFLSAGHFSGWSAHPAVVQFNDGTSLYGYNILSIYGRAGLDLSVPQPVPVEWVNPKRKGRSTGFKGFPLDLSSWDGSDIFLVGDSSHVFVSSRLARALQCSKFKHLLFRNAADCLITDFPPFGDIFPMLSDFHRNTTA